MRLSNAHLPQWLENSSLFRQSFLLRKLLLTKKKLSHYSQFAEDVSISRLFPRNYKGFFVDVGCFHPFRYNNTYRMYTRGWRGINIDIDSIKIEAFNLFRRQDINIACAVGEQSGIVECYHGGFYSLGSTIDKEFAEAHGRHVTRTVECKTLTEIIDGTRFNGRPIDLLSVDTEGNDLSVLKSLDFPRYKPYVVVVESHLEILEDVMESDLYKFLKSEGHSMVAWCGLSLIMANKSYAAPLEE